MEKAAAAGGGGREMNEITIVHYPEYTLEKGWVALCGGDYINLNTTNHLYTMNEQKLSCDCCLEVLVKRRKGTYEEWKLLVENQCQKQPSQAAERK